MTSTHGTPFFSVVIPTYNRTDRIHPVLESVKSQTFNDFECLVIDDGSKDGDTLATIISSLNDSRFVYIRQENKGACNARNRGIDTARGMYIALLDSDDIFLSEKLEKCAKILNENEHDGDVLVYSQMIVERGLEKVWIRPERGLLPAERVDEYLLCTPGKIQTSTMVLPTSLARRIRFDEDLTSMQDADFAIRVANTDATVAFIEEPLIVFGDKLSDSRVSRDNAYRPLLDWIERMRGSGVSERSYWACRGWQCARVASYSNRGYGIWLFLQSLVRGVYSFRQAVIIFAQVSIPHRHYQAIANYVVKLRGQSAVKYRRE